LVVGLIALLALGAGVLHADQGETRLTSAHAIVQAERSNAYYACLNAQAHSLVGPHDVVYLDRPTLSEWVTLTKVLGGWATESLRLDRSTVAVALLHSPGPGSCEGDAVFTIRHRAGGRTVIARGMQAPS
jgi:hypothetical protein